MLPDFGLLHWPTMSSKIATVSPMHPTLVRAVPTFGLGLRAQGRRLAQHNGRDHAARFVDEEGLRWPAMQRSTSLKAERLAGVGLALSQSTTGRSNAPESVFSTPHYRLPRAVGRLVYAPARRLIRQLSVVRRWEENAMRSSRRSLMTRLFPPKSHARAI
jgi:hypothetical protein